MIALVLALAAALAYESLEFNVVVRNAADQSVVGDSGVIQTWHAA